MGDYWRTRRSKGSLLYCKCPLKQTVGFPWSDGMWECERNKSAILNYFDIVLDRLVLIINQGSDGFMKVSGLGLKQLKCPILVLGQQPLEEAESTGPHGFLARQTSK